MASSGGSDSGSLKTLAKATVICDLTGAGQSTSRKVHPHGFWLKP